MSRLLLAGAAATLVVAVGALMIGRGPSQSNVGGTPSGSLMPAPSASASSPASAPASDVPAVLRQDWQADVTTLPDIGAHKSRIQLSFGYDTPDAWIQTGIVGEVSLVLRSAASVAGTAMVRLVSIERLGGCAIGDEGVYRWSVTGDGLYLELEAVSDNCANRRETLERIWVHSLAARNLGGPGVLSYFDPAIQMTLPAANWAAGGGPEVAEINSDVERTFIAARTPAGLSNPCSSTGGAHITIEPTIEAFTTYLESLPDVTVTSTATTIDGKPAVHLAMTTSAATVCEGGRLHQFASSDLSSNTTWIITPGDPDSIWLVDVGEDLYLLQWLAEGASVADQRAVLDTISFIDALPTP